MQPENLNNSETLRQKFEREVIEPTKQAMQEAMARAVSQDDAKTKIMEILPKGHTFLGPLVLYSETGGGGGKKFRNIHAMVQVLNEQRDPEDIEVSFSE